jgi:diketogulonate reductase-like aldo/keto reductase
MIRSITDCAVLDTGGRMPWLGFGVHQMNEGGEVETAVRHALAAGYRSIDTASVYGNERGVGRAVRESGIPRADVFLTTKVWNEDQRRQRVREAFDESLERLGTDYVDLYLIHWPVAGCYRETWDVLREIHLSGRARAIGVSNFLIPHLEDLLRDGQAVPAVNQVEFHPWLVQPELRRFCRDRGIQFEAWSPLMQGQVVNVPVVQELATKHGRSPAQIVLRWNLQHEAVTIPKSARPERIVENAGIFDFELDAADIAALDALDERKRLGPDPANFNF